MTEQMHQIHQVIKKGIDDHNIFGASYSLILPNEIESRYEGVQGENELAIALDPSMIYDLGSMTEVIATTTRIFQLLAIREVGLKDPVTKYLPGFKNAGITILHLLTHTSGLPVEINGTNHFTGVEFTNALYNVNLDFKPGDHVQISPLNFAVLGIIIRAVDGSIDRTVQDRILYPLAMTNTGFNLNRPKIRFVPTRKDAKRGQIQGQVEDKLGLLLNGESGYAGLFSTLNDLTVFIEMMLSRGSYQGKEILDPQLFDVIERFDIDGQSLGWNRFEEDKDIFYGKSPTGIIAFNLKKQQGMVVLHDFVEDRDAREEMANGLLRVIK
ncbi:serine hydrolase [Pediococcus stilesii]|uniref:Serine hydrolase n=1 Tax=Pediococcus stilesii TaxID=331679 RepID=A0A5R9BVK1_9LACO|nr:serine hydrolase [Pediococcus stilesii]TLQ04021.1 serine hydrolase [Pediococcus stilesii]